MEEKYDFDRYQVGIDLGKDEGTIEYIILVEDFIKI